jgi:hypothetical protein
MDSNKDGKLTLEEMQAFIHGKPGDRFRGSLTSEQKSQLG